jgi:hypothetical protein
VHRFPTSWLTAAWRGVLVLAASALLTRAAPPEPPAPPVFPVQVGESTDQVLQTLGNPTGTITRGDATALIYPEGEVEIRQDRVTRIRWQGMVSRTARPATLPRTTPGTIEFRRANPQDVAARHAAERQAVLDKYKQANTRIRVVPRSALPPPAPRPAVAGPATPPKKEPPPKAEDTPEPPPAEPEIVATPPPTPNPPPVAPPTQ